MCIKVCNEKRQSLKIYCCILSGTYITDLTMLVISEVLQNSVYTIPSTHIDIDMAFLSVHLPLITITTRSSSQATQSGSGWAMGIVTPAVAMTGAIWL